MRTLESQREPKPKAREATKASHRTDRLKATRETKSNKEIDKQTSKNQSPCEMFVTKFWDLA